MNSFDDFCTVVDTKVCGNVHWWDFVFL